MDNTELKRLATLGIQSEIDRLTAALHEIQGNGELPEMRAPERKRKKLTPAQRRAIGKRMKEMWAAKRAAKAAGRPTSRRL